ncbi:MAG: MATE family efflux transporter [Lachnospiraceae bacterium]|nr:MATE family efflux transporter [Lachnospiraceae bacterium]
MDKENSLDLTQGSIFKVLMLFVLPIIAGSLIQQLYTTADAIIVGKFAGKAGLAAIDSCSVVFKFPINFLSGLSAGTTIVISNYFGGKNEKRLDHSIHTGYTIAVCLGVICSAAGVIFTPALLKIMAVPEDIFSMSLVYCRISFFGLWSMILYNMAAGMLRAYGDSKSPFLVLLFCCAVNIAGDLLLAGVFDMGVAGAAIATIAAQILSVILSMRYLEKKHCHCDKSVWTVFYHEKEADSILRMGIPLGIQSVLFPAANSIVQANVNTMGTDIIAAWAVCGKLDLLIWLIADSMGPALSTYVAQNLGAKKENRIWKGTITGASVSFVLVGIVSLILYLFPEELGGLFVTDQDAAAILPLVVTYMKMMAPFYIFYSFAESFSGACCGMGDTLKSMLLTLVCTCGLRVAAIFLLFSRVHTMECIVWIYIASWIVSGSLFIIWFILKKVKYRVG